MERGGRKTFREARARQHRARVGREAKAKHWNLRIPGCERQKKKRRGWGGGVAKGTIKLYF